MNTRSKLAILTLLTCLAWPVHGGARPLLVEDADIGQPGSCRAKSWASSGGHYGFLAALAGACVVNLGRPVDLEVEFERQRRRKEWSSEIEIEGKTVLWKGDTVAVAIQAGSGFDLTAGSHESAFVRTPISVEWGDRLQLNFNVGWRYEAEERLHWMLYGAGFEFKLTQPLVLVGEIFSQTGQRNPEEPNASRIRTQLGVRYRHTEHLRIDLLYGHNITGSGGNWFTVGLTLRPPSN